MDSTSLAAVVCLRISSAACMRFRASGSAVAPAMGSLREQALRRLTPTENPVFRTADELLERTIAG